MTDPADALEAADRAYREADAAVAEIGEAALERLASEYEAFVDLLGRYEERASGSGRETFQAYVEFEGKLVEFEERLPADLLERDAFEAAVDHLDRRRLNERDFERARAALEPVANLVNRLDDRAEFRDRYREARRTARDRVRELDARIDDLQSLLEYESVDFDAPVHRLRTPIDTYNDRVLEDFERFRRASAVTDVLDVVAVAADRPLIDMRAPPSDLRSYLEGSPAGDEPIPRLIDWTDYSRSKLAHYVDDPATFLGTVGASRTYLDRLDATALTVDWPPPRADALRWWIREVVPVVDRFAGPETLSALRTLRDVTRDEAYDRLRRVAKATAALTEADRERLASGAVERDLEAAREERARLEAALDDYPSR